ncbi:MAG TPA: DUF3105 domain-containing protein [Candidatus Thioglobus sp.]|jgi:hypothetical protein|nr:DUF3105 domain-containing protein [Candidatus Thioglobus sp.]
MKSKNKNNKKPLLILALLAIAGIVAYIFLASDSQTDNEEMGQTIPIQNRDHISESETVQVYNSNPPTSGPHAGAIKGGYYDGEIEDINGVHNLEHGFIWITYRNVSTETKARLRKIANRHSGRVVVSERRANDAQITLASWGRFDKMSQEELDEDYVIRFIDKYTNKSPEKFAK